MKRLISLALALFLLFSVSAPALAEFSLRNGYTWGMSMEDARALAEKEGLTVGQRQEEDLITYTRVPVGDYLAEEFCLVFDKQADDLWGLSRIAYYFEPFLEDQRADCEAMFDELHTALNKIYGESEESEVLSLPSMKWALEDTKIELTLGPDVIDDEIVSLCDIFYQDARIKNDGF